MEEERTQLMKAQPRFSLPDHVRLDRKKVRSIWRIKYFLIPSAVCILAGFPIGKFASDEAFGGLIAVVFLGGLSVAWAVSADRSNSERAVSTFFACFITVLATIAALYAGRYFL